ncbi:hypothetical protein EIM92_11360 [Paenibacillus lentus]|uniref:Uncharacterized protein n=2 Tax=Paenibacillus lentus TaxID=1338368 RepID=A0A3Q8SEQ3_9BACL|nr:hypothetical protein EIM92_11360 [Paenibacillus lentus]
MDEQFLRVIQEQERKEREEAKEEQLSIPKVTAAVLSGLLKLGSEEITFSETEVIPGQVSLRMPESFVEMPEQFAAMKYPSDRRPKLIYTDESLSININVNPTDNRMYDDEMEKFQSEMLAMLKRMQPNARWLSDGVFTLGQAGRVEVEQAASEQEGQLHQKEAVQASATDGKRVGYYEFLSPAMDGNIYNLTFFMEWEEKGLFFSVNCMEKQMKLWRPIAHGIMASLRIIGSSPNEGEG